MWRSIRTSLTLGCLLVGAWTPAFTATFVVDRFDDPFPDAFCDNAIPNDCSLRDAILAANVDGSPDIIQLPAGTYLLTRSGSDEDAGVTGDLDVLAPVAIQGADETTTIIEAGGSGVLNDRVFEIGTGVIVEMSDLTIRGGVGSPQGGGIKSSGNTTLTRVTLTENESIMQGGAVWNGGSMTVLESTVSGNRGSRGGGIDSDGTLMIHDSSLLGNEATGSFLGGGGLLHFHGTTTVTESTIDGNHALDLPGGGVYAIGGGVLIEDSRITSNRSSDSLDAFAGAGLALVGGTDVTIRRTVIAANEAFGERAGGIAIDMSTVTIEDSSIVWNESDANAGGIYNDGGIIFLVNSTLARNTGSLNGAVVQASGDIFFSISTVVRNSGIAPFGTLSGSVTFRDSIYSGNCFGGATFTSIAGNLFAVGHSCGGISDVEVEDEAAFLLSAVGENGGPTPTARLFADSPALDIAITCPPPNFDQRGEPRPIQARAAGIGTGCDAGSVEVQPDELDALFFDGFESGDTSIWSSTL